VTAAFYTLAPDVPDLSALGATQPEDLLGTGSPLLEEARAERVGGSAGSQLWRCPLPGTPGSDGRRNGPPRGAGTGWIYIRRYQQPTTRDLLRARLTHPRSDSLAQRDWNLLCHMRAEGVNTPEPLAVGSTASSWIAKRSFLVTRALDEVQPLIEWLAQSGVQLDVRRRGLRAVGLMLRRLFTARVELPGLRLEHIQLSIQDPVRADLDADACSMEQIAQVRADRSGALPIVDGNLRWRRLPTVVLTSVVGGGITKRVRPGSVRKCLRSLNTEALACELQRSDRLRVALRAAPRDSAWGRVLRSWIRKQR
jgi:hypothetical protein